MDNQNKQGNHSELRGEPLTKKELNSIWLRWYFTNLSSMSYEKLMGHTPAFSLIPLVEKYYKDDEEGRKSILTRQSVFFNVEPQIGQLINGINTSLEENIARGGEVSPEVPNTIKTALMGPLAGLGDSILQGILIPILLSIAMGLASDGSPIGPIFYIVAYGIIGTALTYFSYHAGYRLGVGAIDVIVGENANRIIRALNVVGVMVVGALAASNVALTTVLNIPNGSEFIPLQATLDGAFPGLLGMLSVLGAWYLLNKKRYSPTKVLIIIVIAVTALCLLGVC